MLLSITSSEKEAFNNLVNSTKWKLTIIKVNSLSFGEIVIGIIAVNNRLNNKNNDYDEKLEKIMDYSELENW